MDPVLEGLKLALAVVLLAAGVKAFLRYGKRKYEEDARSGDFSRYKGAARDRIEAYAAELKAKDEADARGGK